MAQHTATGFFKMELFHRSLLMQNIFMQKLYFIFLNSWFSPVLIFLSVLVLELTFVSNEVDGLTWWIWKKHSLISFWWTDGNDLAKTIKSLPKSCELWTSLNQLNLFKTITADCILSYKRMTAVYLNHCHSLQALCQFVIVKNNENYLIYGISELIPFPITMSLPLKIYFLMIGSVKWPQVSCASLDTSKY